MAHLIICDLPVKEGIMCQDEDNLLPDHVEAFELFVRLGSYNIVILLNPFIDTRYDCINVGEKDICIFACHGLPQPACHQL